MKKVKKHLTNEEMEKWLNKKSEHLLDGLTGREYLEELLMTLWEEKERFSGKRPFGNSAWDYDVAASLIETFPDLGQLDADGDVNEVDDDLVNLYVKEIIEYVFRGKNKNEITDKDRLLFIQSSVKSIIQLRNEPNKTKLFLVTVDFSSEKFSSVDPSDAIDKAIEYSKEVNKLTPIIGD